jgi:hypothetical protein
MSTNSQTIANPHHSKITTKYGDTTNASVGLLNPYHYQQRAPHEVIPNLI